MECRVFGYNCASWSFTNCATEFGKICRRKKGALDIVCVCVCVQEFDEHMGSDGHAANMQVMSAVYHDKNQQLLTSSFDSLSRKSSTGASR